MMKTHYLLACVACGRLHNEADQDFLLNCGREHGPSLLRTVYDNPRFSVQPGNSGIFRYADWLPVRRILKTAGRPIVYKSKHLAAELGLERLYIAFSGYWPDRGAGLETCSFKELEALCVCARVQPETTRTMVVASAGNTARAFLQIGSINRVPLLVVVPESALPDMWMTVEKDPCVKLAVLKGKADYLEAIELADSISRMNGFYSEGGARNVARRDGMGTVMLAAAEETGEVPDHYFQAVGSGTGGIAAWEMSMRLQKDGRYGRVPMKLHFVQNEPFTIMTQAWNARTREIPLMEADEARKKTALLHSRVLSNRKPPYAIAGGVFDALSSTGGTMYSVPNEEARAAGPLFEKTEGCDIDPAAQVALAGLVQAAGMGLVDKRQCVLLNVTGGGAGLIAAEGRKRWVAPDMTFTPEDARDTARVQALLNV